MSGKQILYSQRQSAGTIFPLIKMFVFCLFFSVAINYTLPLCQAQAYDKALTETEELAAESIDKTFIENKNDDISDETEDASGNLRETFDPEYSWVDDYYDKTNIYVHGFVFKADDFLGDEQLEDLPTLKRSRFNLAIDTKFEDREGLKFNFDLDFRADIKLPKTRERLGIFVNTSNLDELPGEDPGDVENSVLLGLEAVSLFKQIPFVNFYGGVRVSLNPAVFTGVNIQPHFTWVNFQIIPQQKVFWFSNDTGLGGLTALRMEWKPKDGFLLRSLSAARYSDETLGIEWEQSFLFGFSPRGSLKNLDTGHAIKLSAFGHKTGSGIVDYYRIYYLYRRNIFKKWLFIQLGPEARFRNEDDWKISPGFRIGFDMLFWLPEDLTDNVK